MWLKLTWMLFAQKKCEGSSEKTVRALIYQWKYVKCFIWNVINLSPLLSLLSSPSLSLRPALETHTHTHTNTHTEGDKSHCEPGPFPVLMTSCLQTRRAVSQGSWSLTPSRSVCLSLISYPSIQMTFGLMERLTGLPLGNNNMNTPKGCSSLGNAELQQTANRGMYVHNTQCKNKWENTLHTHTHTHTHTWTNLAHTHTCIHTSICTHTLTSITIAPIPKSPNEGKNVLLPKGQIYSVVTHTCM